MIKNVFEQFCNSVGMNVPFEVKSNIFEETI